MGPRLTQIRASAGSGKTYKLVWEYMELLKMVQGNCARNEMPAKAAEILAITFTNAAAEEMRQRVVKNLKKAALGIQEPWEDRYPPEVARAWLNVFLDDLSAVNIRTIDSLLHQIIRACALDLGLSPEYETVFDTEEALAPHMERLLEQSRQDATLREMLGNACDAIIERAREPRFSRGEIIRKEINEVLESVLAEKFNDLTPQEEIAAALEKYKAETRQVAQSLLICMGDKKANKINGSAYTVFEEIARGEPSRWGKDSAYLNKDSVAEVYNKGGTPPEGADELYQRLRRRFPRAAELMECFKSSTRYSPLIAVAEAVAKAFLSHTERDAVLPQARAPNLASSVLKPLGEVSTALCRMGDRLRYYLVDEFQDTSIAQWNVLKALVLEALSQGGVMLWVGDPKQSIYGWREGKPELFNQVLRDRQLTRIAPNADSVEMGYNRRSCPAIVEFNSQLFGPLQDRSGTVDLIRRVLGDKFAEAIVASAAARIAEAFADVRQKPGKIRATANGEKAGYVRLERVEGESISEARADAIERVKDLLLEEIGPRMAWSDVLILVRANDDARAVVEALADCGVQAITENGLALNENLLVRQLVAFLHFLDDPRNDVALWTWLSGSIFLDSPETAEFTLEDFAGIASGRGKQPLASVFSKAYPRIWERLFKPFFHQATMLTPYDLLMELVRRTHVEERFAEDRTMLRRLMETAHRAEAMSCGSLREFLIYWKEKGGKERAPMPEGLDAVRVMTVHKAKGLERRVVIIPDTAFRISASDSVQPLKQKGLGTVAVKLRSAMGAPYQEDMCNQLQEALNLLYVAFTRPEEELYIFQTISTRDKASRNASQILDVLFKGASPFESGEKPPMPSVGKRFAHQLQLEAGAIADLALQRGLSRPALQCGTPEATGMKTDFSVHNPCSSAGRVNRYDKAFLGSAGMETREGMGGEHEGEAWRPMGWLSRLKIFYTPLPEAKMSSRQMGLLVHSALANWHEADSLGGSIADALKIAQVETGIRPDGEAMAKAHSFLLWLLGHDEARRWWPVALKEQPMLDENGRYMRADFLVPTPSGCLVVDFKTGDPKEENVAQVQRYMKCLQASGQFPGDVRGLLIYLNWRRFQRVDVAGGGELTHLLPKEFC